MVLIAGSARRLNEEARRATRLVGAGLARHGFGLLTGSWTGVDGDTSEAFLRALRETGESPVDRYLQIHHRRWQPFSTVVQRDRRLRLDVATDRESYGESVLRCQAGIVIGGVGGAKKVAFELLGSNKPVFPLPLTGGDALAAYAEILEQWSEREVHGVTRNQFMELSLPLGRDADRLMRMLSAALRDRVDVFVSYRRQDLPAAAGRIAESLADHLGPRRVFLDMQSIAPGAEFGVEIQKALRDCRVVLCLIGPRWDTNRLGDDDDYIRREVRAAIEARKPVVPIVAYGGRLPDRNALPNDLHGLLARQAVFIENNAAWPSGMLVIRDEIDRILAGRRDVGEV
jgi:hypothetical protein